MGFLKLIFTNITIISLLFFESFALSINSDLLKVQAAFMPKVILMDYNYKKKLIF